MKRLGLSYDWSREIATCLPEYYRWNQWMFLKMYERGLVYRKRSAVNWCRSCETVLANEQVEAGLCWRCSNEVAQKEIEGWFAFYGWYGFISCFFLVIAARGLRKLVMRDEDYYDRDYR